MTSSVSPRRADTRRNRERILAAAAASLAAAERISFNAIAKQAGVGVGTVYRHFPTPEALILSVYEREVRQLVELVPRLLEKHPPEQALRIWVTDHVARYMMTKRGLAKALVTATGTSDELPKAALATLIDAVATFLDANVAAGTVRPGLDPEIVVFGFGGLFHLDPRGDWRGTAVKVWDLVWRGMRAGQCGNQGME